MLTVGIYEAKTHFAQLVNKVAKGERVTITRHGVAVARLLPPAENAKPDVRDTIAKLQEFRKGRSLGGITFRELVEEGRRY